LHQRVRGFIGHYANKYWYKQEPKGEEGDKWLENCPKWEELRKSVVSWLNPIQKLPPNTVAHWIIEKNLGQNGHQIRHQEKGIIQNIKKAIKGLKEIEEEGKTAVMAPLMWDSENKKVIEAFYWNLNEFGEDIISTKEGKQQKMPPMQKVQHLYGPGSFKKKQGDEVIKKVSDVGKKDGHMTKSKYDHHYDEHEKPQKKNLAVGDNSGGNRSFRKVVVDKIMGVPQNTHQGKSMKANGNGAKSPKVEAGGTGKPWKSFGGSFLKMLRVIN
jgi:hypothetical protein